MARPILATCALLALTLLIQSTSSAQQAHKQFIPSSAAFAILSSPMDAIQQPSMELFPYEVVTTMGQKNLGFDPCKIKHFTVVVDAMDNLDNPPGFGVVIEFADPQKIEDMSEMVLSDFEKSEFKGKVYYQSVYDEEMPGFYQHNETTIIVGLKPFLSKMLNSQGAQSKLLTLVDQHQGDNHLGIYMAMEPVRGLLKENLPPAEQVPPMFRNFLELPDLIDSAVSTANFSGNGKSVMMLNAASAADAKRMQEIMNEGVELGKQMAMMQLQEAMQGEDPDLQESVQRYVTRVAKHMESNYMPVTSEDGKSLVFQTEAGGGGASVATIGILTGMLLPAVQQVREAARRTDSANRLRQFALACHNHESAFREFPKHAIYSEDGMPLLSWRVKILPFIEQNALYEKFHLDEPWDSEHNIKLLDEMPEMYRSPNSMHTNKTIFLALEGEGTFMDGTNGRNRIQDIKDGTSNTVMFVEADENMAVEWTKPADLDFDPENPMRGLGTLRPGGFNAAFCDGSIHFISWDLDPEMFRRMALRNDGEIVDH
jgi:hypothetical protein